MGSRLVYPKAARQAADLGLPQIMGAAIGDRLRSARRAAGLTQVFAGKMAGCDHSHISKVEAGKDPPSFPLILRLAAIYGVPARDLLPPDHPLGDFEIAATEQEAAWLLHFRRAHPEQRAALFSALGVNRGK